MDKIVFNPCLNCGSNDYDQFEIPPQKDEIKVVTPTSCDKCLEKIKSESEMIH